VLGRAERLPDAQRATLGRVLGAGGGERPVDAYRAGLAVLDLLGDVAEEQRVVVVAEDVHWLDDPTCDVLAFVARRIEADPIAMSMTSRESVPASIRTAGLPSRRLGPLTPAVRVEAVADHGRRDGGEPQFEQPPGARELCGAEHLLTGGDVVRASPARAASDSSSMIPSGPLRAAGPGAGGSRVERRVRRRLERIALLAGRL
jgi:hypothetical protein